MGIIEPYEAAWVMDAIESALSDMGRREYEGIAGRVFNRVYFEEMQR
jgi:hypothetical protein